ncbi:hypothetical protein [Endozoicomonas sp. YOMI1]|uniref:IS66 family insertion sequence element accessory protein TnpA n=1 Tax=Endozoicomonas sp. YOMI1 TaxID=2828739 RepID=UPI0021480A29|nr:hypothetical protein [Endozoicomonas sp. YOMI1]
MHQNTSNRRTSSQWQNLINQQQESGVSQKAFCELNDICLSTFTLWKRKLTQATVKSAQPEHGPEWHQLPTGFDDPVPDPSKWDMELELPGGVILRMRR